MKTDYTHEAAELLCRLISIPSVSREETQAANELEAFINRHGLTCQRQGNNVWTQSTAWDSQKPTVLLNAHIDTVKPVATWTRNPFEPTLDGDTLYGLGANDCGGGLVSLLQAFRILNGKEQAYNLIYLASAEEEVSGKDGIRSVLPLLPKIDVAIVGEPTGLQPAIAEKGLMVLDVTAHGQSAHAATGKGVNAIYKAMDDLRWLQTYKFERISTLLGPTLMNVTMIQAGTQHNVVPDECHFVVDVRSNECYTNEELFDFISAHLNSNVKARSLHLCSSHISPDHPLIRRCTDMGMTPYGSPTLSDQSLMRFPSFKLGPGESTRSHAADEFIRLSEIDQAITTYLQLLDGTKVS